MKPDENHKHNLKNKRDMHNLATGYSDNYVPLEALDLSRVKTVDDLVKGMKNCAFGARNVGEAADVLEAMARDKDCFKVLTLSGAMTIAKMGLVICDMVDHGLADAIVSTGALQAHGFVESVGMRHFKYTWNMEDEELYEKGYDRVYDTLELEKNLDDVSLIVDEVMGKVKDDEVLCSYKINHLLGEYLVKKTNGRGILKSAYEKKVPVYVPAFTDSEVGLDVALHNRKRADAGRNQLVFNPFLDLEHFTEKIHNAKKIGIFTIGGGVPRNWAQQGACYLDLINSRLGRKGDFKRYSYAVRICPEPVNWGGLCLHGDTKIDCPRDLSEYRQGISIKELVNKENFPVYSYDDEKKRIVVANVRRVFSSGVKKLYKVKFGWIAGWSADTQELKMGEIVASADHKFMLRSGAYKTVSELKENDRLMPFNSHYKQDKHGEYRFISLNNGKKAPEHRFIMEEMLARKLGLSEAVHHLDHNTLNNCPDNLDIMDFVDHARYHRFAQSEESKEKQRNTLRMISDPELMQQRSRKYWDNITEEEYQILCQKRKHIASEPEERKRRSSVSSRYWNEMDLEQKRIRLKNAHDSTRKKWSHLDLSEERIKDALIKEKGIANGAIEKLGIGAGTFYKYMKKYRIDKDWIKNNCTDNHFVISVDFFGEAETYDMNVDNTHNFAANGIIISNSGCSYSESVSWGKIVPKSEGGMYAEVFDDATIAWPMIVKAVLERLGKS